MPVEPLFLTGPPTPADSPDQNRHLTVPARFARRAEAIEPSGIADEIFGTTGHHLAITFQQR